MPTTYDDDTGALSISLLVDGDARVSYGRLWTFDDAPGRRVGERGSTNASNWF